MVKVAVNVSVEKVEEANSSSASSSCICMLDINLRMKKQMFSGDEPIYEFPETPINIPSISLPCHSNVQNPAHWRSCIESVLESSSDSPEVLCAKDVLLKPTTQIQEHPVCIVDLVADRVASSSDSEWNRGRLRLVANVEIVSVVDCVNPKLGFVFKKGFKKFKAIDELKQQAFQIAPTSSGSGNEGGDDGLVGSDCSICLQGLCAAGIHLIRLPNCNHVFHQHCVHPWLKTSDLCPLCRDFFWH